MTLCTALYRHLATDATIAAIAGDRVYPMDPPQPELGADLASRIVYALTDQQDGTLDVGGGTNTWVSSIVVTIDAADPDTAWTLGDAVRDRLHKFSGAMGESPGVEVLVCTMTGRADDVDREHKIYGQALSFDIHHSS
jgi:hypothetical protein